VCQLHHWEDDRLTKAVRFDDYGGIEVLELGIAKDRIDTIVDFPSIKKYGVKGEGGAAAASAATLAELAEAIAAGDPVVPVAADRDRVIVGTQRAEALLSSDDGRRWERMELPERDVFSVAIGPADRTLYAGGCLYRSRYISVPLPIPARSGRAMRARPERLCSGRAWAGDGKGSGLHARTVVVGRRSRLAAHRSRRVGRRCASARGRGAGVPRRSRRCRGRSTGDRGATSDQGASYGEGCHERLDPLHVHLLSRSPLTMAATCVNGVGAT
jgi:hypothetical protein